MDQGAARDRGNLLDGRHALSAEAVLRAKARGVHMGRRSALNQNQRREAMARIEAGDALTDIARTFGVSHTTIARLKEKAGL